MAASGPSCAKATEVGHRLGEGGRSGILTRAQEGDDEAFGALVQQHSRRVFQLAFRMTRNEQDAEDVVQESFLRAYRQLGNFESRADFGTWLYRITANCAVDMMRTRGHRLRQRSDALDSSASELRCDSPTPEHLAEGAQLGRLVERALDGLTALERAAFTLRHHEGRSITEICAALRLHRSAAKHAIFRAVRKLRLTLEPLRATSRAAGDEP
jgi:RNA polymerase sigma-70 factor (ECF subfamily)